MTAELPNPLTPSGCDLRGFPFLPLDTVRLMDSDLFALSTGEEFKAALTLWCKSWQQIPAASLPDDDKVLAYLSGAGRRWKAIKALALRGFVKCSDGRLYHPVVAEKAREAWAHRLKQRAKANQRWSERGITPADATASPAAKPSADAAAMQQTGTGNTVSKDTAVPASISDQDRLWRDAVPYIRDRAGKPENQARSIIGKWARDHGATVVLAAVSRAQAEQAVEPIAFVAAVLGDKRKSDDVFQLRPLGAGG